MRSLRDKNNVILDKYSMYVGRWYKITMYNKVWVFRYGGMGDGINWLSDNILCIGDCYCGRNNKYVAYSGEGNRINALCNINQEFKVEIILKSEVIRIMSGL
jgi:hypothetical protein